MLHLPIAPIHIFFWRSVQHHSEPPSSRPCVDEKDAVCYGNCSAGTVGSHTTFGLKEELQWKRVEMKYLQDRSPGLAPSGATHTLNACPYGSVMDKSVYRYAEFRTSQVSLCRSRVSTHWALIWLLRVFKKQDLKNWFSTWKYIFIYDFFRFLLICEILYFYQIQIDVFSTLNSVF